MFYLDIYYYQLSELLKSIVSIKLKSKHLTKRLDLNFKQCFLGKEWWS